MVYITIHLCQELGKVINCALYVMNLFTTMKDDMIQ
jgi:hypothetical protein